MPQFLRKRRAVLPAVQDAIAALLQRLGLDRRLYFTMVLLHQIEGSYNNAPVTLSQIRSCATFAYSAIDNISAPVSALKERGMLLDDGTGGLSLAPEAREAVEGLHAVARANLGMLELLPVGELELLMERLESAVHAILNDPVLMPRPGSQLAGSRSLATFGPDAPALVRLEQAIFDLWMARDDAHVKAWRDAGIPGPAVRVLTTLWLGEASTATGLADALRGDQTPENLESSLVYLTEKELVQRHGDLVHLTPKGVMEREDIERDTDHIYFAPWPDFTVEEASWLRDKLRELVANLPTPGAPPAQ